MSIAEKLTAIAEDLPKVYDSGVDKGESSVWDVIQGVGGTRIIYDHAFRFWGGEYIHPKYKVIPMRKTAYVGGQHLRFVFEYAKVKKIESKYFDFSNVNFNANSNLTDCIYGFFRYCDNLEEIEDIGLNAGGYYYTYNGCSKLHTIAVMRCVKEGTYNGVFTNCTALKNITIEGVIGTNFNISACGELSKASQDSIIDHLADLTGETAQTISWHSKIVESLSDEQISRIESKNWIYE